MIQNNPDYVHDPEYPMDDDYVQWCAQSSECIKVPGTDHYVSNDGVRNIVVRANKWGRTYYPLTAWLTANNIPWEEF